MNDIERQGLPISQLVHPFELAQVKLLNSSL